MGITAATLLTEGSSTTDQAFYESAAFTPPTSKPFAFGILAASNVGIAAPASVVGQTSGLTLTKKADISWSVFNLSLWYGLTASPQNEVFRATAPGAESWRSGAWGVVTLDGAAATPFDQSATSTGTGSPFTVTLPGITSGSAVLVLFGESVNVSPSLEAGWTSLASQTQGSPNLGFRFGWRNADDDLTATATSSGTPTYGAIIAEILAAGAGASAMPLLRRRRAA